MQKATGLTCSFSVVFRNMKLSIIVDDNIHKIRFSVPVSSAVVWVSPHYQLCMVTRPGKYSHEKRQMQLMVLSERFCGRALRLA